MPRPGLCAGAAVAWFRLTLGFSTALPRRAGPADVAPNDAVVPAQRVESEAHAKREVMKRDDGQCSNCGSTQAVGRSPKTLESQKPKTKTHTPSQFLSKLHTAPKVHHDRLPY